MGFGNVVLNARLDVKAILPVRMMFPVVASVTIVYLFSGKIIYTQQRLQHTIGSYGVNSGFNESGEHIKECKFRLRIPLLA